MSVLSSIIYNVKDRTATVRVTSNAIKDEEPEFDMVS